VVEGGLWAVPSRDVNDNESFSGFCCILVLSDCKSFSGFCCILVVSDCVLVSVCFHVVVLCGYRLPLWGAALLVLVGDVVQVVMLEAPEAMASEPGWDLAAVGVR